MSANSRQGNVKIRQGYVQKGIVVDGQLTITPKPVMARAVQELAIRSGAASAESYGEQIIEWFLMEHRSNKLRLDPLRHTELREWECIE